MTKMSYSDTISLEDQLENLCLMLDKQISVIAIEADKMGIDPVELRTSDGSWALSELLTSKAQALHALVLEKRQNNYVVNIYNGGEVEQ